MESANQSAGPGVDGGQLSPGFVRAAKRILRPLVRLLLSQGVTYPYLADLLKGIYVEVAGTDFALAGKRQTDSRLSLITGVHRKDVRRLAHATTEDPESVPENLSLGNRLIARWCSDPLYVDDSGRAKPLPRLARSDQDVSFERLVAAESKDIRARAVLDDWLHLGRVEIDAEDRVCLRTEAFVPPADFAERIYFVGNQLRDHIAAAAHNVMGNQPPFLERSAYETGLTPAAVKELADIAERQGMEALRTVYKRAQELKKSKRASHDAPQRICFGIYFFKEDVVIDVTTHVGAEK